jgi:hypothetical protein
MIGQVIMVVLRRVHNDGRPVMGLVRIGMHDIRFGVVIRSASGVGSRSKPKRRSKT